MVICISIVLFDAFSQVSDEAESRAGDDRAEERHQCDGERRRRRHVDEHSPQKGQDDHQRKRLSQPRFHLHPWKQRQVSVSQSKIKMFETLFDIIKRPLRLQKLPHFFYYEN